MGTELMGQVLVTAKVENLEDLHVARRGQSQVEKVRAIVVDDALADTGATGLGLPGRMIQDLGLEPLRTRRARTSAGPVMLRVFGAVRLTIQGRECFSDVSELPDDCPVLIGQIPLEALDFVVDPKNWRLIGNPEHDGEHILEFY